MSAHEANSLSGDGDGGDAACRVAAVYPQDASAANPDMDVIEPAQVETLHGLFRERVARSPEQTAYIQYQPSAGAGDWVEYSWRQIDTQVARWRRALAAEGLAHGERVAVCMRNRVEWVLYDQACMACGLVVTPLYAEDRADNIAYVMEQTGARLLLVETADLWRQMAAELAPLSALKRVVVLEASDDADATPADLRVVSLTQWLESALEPEPEHETAINASPPTQSDDLAGIIYTSGTTGKPKGVMLSHANILSNARAGLKSVAVLPSDKFLSFLPLSHMFERTVGYYLPMMAGASVAFNRSIAELPDDLLHHQPTVMITVPRIFERAYGAITTRLEQRPAPLKWLFERAIAVGWRRFEIAQGRAGWRAEQWLWPLLKALVANPVRRRFGGNLRFVISGGAPLAPAISRVFIACGIDILQGYGLTETGPTLTVNTLRHNKPASIGLPFIGAEIRLSARGELQARSPSVMRGYWQNEDATRGCIDADGWFSTGDLAGIDADGFLFITGRLKEIIVTATGEKVPPADMEAAICDDPLFEQAMVLGEGRPFLCAVIVLNPDSWQQHAAKLGVAPHDAAAVAGERVEHFVLDKVAHRLRDFPGYAAVRRVCVTTEAWSVDDGSLTPTLKIKRAVLRERFAAQIERLYAERA